MCYMDDTISRANSIDRHGINGVMKQRNRSDWCDCDRCNHCGGLRNRPLFPKWLDHIPNPFPNPPFYPQPRDLNPMRPDENHRYDPNSPYHPTYGVTHDYRVGHKTTCSTTEQ